MSDCSCYSTPCIRTAVSTCARYFICISLCRPPFPFPLSRFHTELTVYLFLLFRTPSSCSCGAPNPAMFYRCAILFFSSFLLINCAIINADSEKIPRQNAWFIPENGFSSANYLAFSTFLLFIELLMPCQGSQKFGERWTNIFDDSRENGKVHRKSLSVDQIFSVSLDTWNY